ncbi:hypothetical protein, conserved [Eimeria tenella]|uniref:Uncharacterized protein n=1 Tax=Eimeria tenella TaxID=5802 RepID=U6L5X2_EIMTE|nr:hypothetical protein, conserved [Eimeria tenella]CDJ43964.1 hypothetical protein, conserved [Eimeria tenella]|eukprot:XP_013234713.1 hypothetical protein, conserved [Eimeria tenella]
MEFPACRTPEWLRAAFDGPEEPQAQPEQQQQQKQQQQQQQQAAAAGPLKCPDFVFTGLDATPRLLLATPSSTTTTASRRITGSSNSSSSSSSSSSGSLYAQRAAAVSNSIREALFRQALFQIQNVEVQTLRSCRGSRFLAAAAVTFDRQQQQQQQQQRLQQQQQRAAAADGAFARAKETAKTLLLRLSSSSSSSSSSLGELLRREEWQVDRCGSMRAYEVSVHRDAADFYTVTLNPKEFCDKLRRWWFKWADTNDD